MSRLPRQNTRSYLVISTLPLEYFYREIFESGTGWCGCPRDVKERLGGKFGGDLRIVAFAIASVGMDQKSRSLLD